MCHFMATKSEKNVQASTLLASNCLTADINDIRNFNEKLHHYFTRLFTLLHV